MTEEIRDAIRSGGAIPFERFMELALYGEQGFYMLPDGGSAGRHGDFITSPEVGPLFGAVLYAVPRRRVAEDRATGPVHRGRPRRRPGHAGAVDHRLVPRLRGHAAVRRRRGVTGAAGETPGRHVESLVALPSQQIDGVILANELLDNLPFRLVVFDQTWREAFVDLDASGRFVEVLSAPFDPIPVDPPARSAVSARARP